MRNKLELMFALSVALVVFLPKVALTQAGSSSSARSAESSSSRSSSSSSRSSVSSHSSSSSSSSAIPLCPNFSDECGFFPPEQGRGGQRAPAFLGQNAPKFVIDLKLDINSQGILRAAVEVPSEGPGVSNKFFDTTYLNVAGSTDECPLEEGGEAAFSQSSTVYSAKKFIALSATSGIDALAENLERSFALVLREFFKDTCSQNPSLNFCVSQGAPADAPVEFHGGGRIEPNPLILQQALKSEPYSIWDGCTKVLNCGKVIGKVVCRFANVVTTPYYICKYGPKGPEICMMESIFFEYDPDFHDYTFCPPGTDPGRPERCKCLITLHTHPDLPDPTLACPQPDEDGTMSCTTVAPSTSETANQCGDDLCCSCDSVTPTCPDNQGPEGWDSYTSTQGSGSWFAGTCEDCCPSPMHWCYADAGLAAACCYPDEGCRRDINGSPVCAECVPPETVVAGRCTCARPNHRCSGNATGTNPVACCTETESCGRTADGTATCNRCPTGTTACDADCCEPPEVCHLGRCQVPVSSSSSSSQGSSSSSACAAPKHWCQDGSYKVCCNENQGCVSTGHGIPECSACPENENLELCPGGSKICCRSGYMCHYTSGTQVGCVIAD